MALLKIECDFAAKDTLKINRHGDKLNLIINPVIRRDNVYIGVNKAKQIRDYLDQYIKQNE